MIKSLGMLKNIPLNTDLNDLFLIEEECGGYRCLYPNTQLNYPVNDTGYLIITKAKTVGEMLYVTKRGIYRRSFYIKNNQAKIITNWSKLSLGSNLREVSDLTTRGLMSFSEVKGVIQKYLVNYDPTHLNNVINSKADKHLLNNYYNKTGGNLHHYRRLSTGVHIKNHHNIYFNAGLGIRQNFSNAITGTPGTPPTPPNHIPFYNNGSPNADLANHLYEIEKSPDGHYRHGNIIGLYDPNYLDIGDRWGDMRLESVTLRSNIHPHLNANQIPGHWDRRMVTQEDLRWKLVFDARAGHKDVTVSFHDTIHEVIIQGYSDFNNGGYEDLEPMHFIPGIYCRLNYYHHTFIWNRDGHNRMIVERTRSWQSATSYGDERSYTNASGSITKSFCPLCNHGDRYRRLKKYSFNEEFYFNINGNFHNNVSIRRIWVR